MKNIWPLIKSHYPKFVLLIFSIPVMALILFPFNELSDLVSVQVSKLSQNQVFIQFDRMDVSLFPSPSISLENVDLDTPLAAGLRIDRLMASPSLARLITQKPGGDLSLEGLLGGQLEVSLKGGTKTESGISREKILISGDKISLSELKKVLSLPVTVKGKLRVTGEAQVDQTFEEQPEMDIEIAVDQFEMPPANLNTAMMGDLPLPELKLNQVRLKGRLVGGRIQIEEGTIGSPTDDLTGSIKGGMALQVSKRGSQIQPLIGSYSFDIELDMNKGFQDKIGLFVGFISSYGKPSPKGMKYGLRVAGTSLQSPPNITSLSR